MCGKPHGSRHLANLVIHFGEVWKLERFCGILPAEQII
jgi:hypothetical protein